KWVGLVLLFSVETGEPLALFPDAHLQHFRVGATNGLGTKYLSRPDSRRVGLLGTGWQAEARLQAYQEVRKITNVAVYSPRNERRTAFARKMSELLQIEIEPTDSPEAAVEGADIIAAATSSIRPVIDPRWVMPGVHVDCLRELEFDQATLDLVDVAAYNRRDPLKAPVITCRRDRITRFSEGTEGGYPEVDDPEGWWNHRTAWDRMTTLEDLISGRHAGRESDRQTTLFLSRGVAHQFSAVGSVVLQEASRLGLGHEIPATTILQDRPT
ncbi:MAG: ornithine cyclodeaminase family protein, partial [Chloroflexota bacterium]|nr:ornithine cyclodeaminase family protein [Chloroflexota bacterium]